MKIHQDKNDSKRDALHQDWIDAQRGESNDSSPVMPRNMTCACGSVLSAVTFTCVRGKFCPLSTKPSHHATVLP